MMDTITAIKKALEGVSSAFNRVLAEAPISSDNYSIGFDCQGKAIRIDLEDMRTITQLLSTIESLQRENEKLEARRKEEQERADRIAADWFEFCEMMDVTPDTQEAVAEELQATIGNAKAEVKRLREALKSCADYIESPLRLSSDGEETQRRQEIVAIARTALSSTGDTHAE